MLKITPPSGGPLEALHGHLAFGPGPHHDPAACFQPWCKYTWYVLYICTRAPHRCRRCRHQESSILGMSLYRSLDAVGLHGYAVCLDQAYLNVEPRKQKSRIVILCF